MLNVADGKIYNVRVKSINALGVSSTYTSANRTIIGLRTHQVMYQHYQYQW